MPAHLRVSLADRPGALASLTRALAAVGANVLSLTVVQREAGRAVDDLLLDWPFERPWDAVVRAVEGCTGARLHGLRHVANTESGHDADLIRQVAAQPHRALEVLVDALPALLLADWAAICDRRWPREPVFATTESPLPLPVTPAALPRPRAIASEDAPIAAVPCGGAELRVIVGRTSGPAFTKSELDRCAAIVDVVVAVARLGYLDRPLAAPTTVSSRILASTEVQRTG
jgi:hypothetical protein